MDTCNNMGESQMHYAKSSKVGSTGYILFDSIYMTFQKSQDSSGSKQISGDGGATQKGP